MRSIIRRVRPASERNVAYFELAHSLDGKTFDVIGKMSAKNTPSVYALSEKATAHVLYYKLKTVDNDGKTRFSNIITLENATIKSQIQQCLRCSIPLF